VRDPDFFARRNAITLSDQPMKISLIKLGTAVLVSAFAITGFAQTTNQPPEPLLWNLEVGLNYVTGDYGLPDDTDVWVQTTTIHYEQDAWHFQATAPLISISGPASVVGNVGRANTSTKRGLGDVMLGATYKLTDAATGASDFDFGARVKLPTAKENNGLGTGEVDTYFEVNYHHTFGTITPFATLGYRFLGRSPAYPLEDGFYTTVGVAAPLADRTTGGLAYTWCERIVTNADDASELMAFVSHQLNNRWKLQGYVLTGFTDASPNFGLGALVGYKF
jgi:hypothetical protein